MIEVFALLCLLVVLVACFKVVYWALRLVVLTVLALGSVVAWIFAL